MKQITLIAILVCSVAFADEVNFSTHEKGIWSLAEVGEMERWIVIHNLAEALETGIFHIDVIGRNAGEPEWSIFRLSNHIAITSVALSESVIEPLNKGAVYPESFQEAYSEWLKASPEDQFICRTTVSQCITR